MANLRAGLVGLGMMGRHHSRVLGSLEGVEFVAVAEPTGERFNAANGVRIVGSVSELISMNIDYCVVAVPTVHHESVALELASAGVHALIEKPLSYNEESSNRITQQFERNGLIAAVGHIERYNPALQQARKRIENGDLGDIIQVATRRQGPFPGRVSDVGVLKDLGTHDIDLTAWVTQQRYASVSAQTVYRSGREHEDLVSITAKLTEGTVSNHLINWLSPLKERTTIITGEKGTFVADTLTADLTFHKNGNVETAWSGLSLFRGVSEGETVKYAFEKPEPLRTEHESFRHAIASGDSSGIVTLREGLQVMGVLEAVLESARANTIVNL